MSYAIGILTTRPGQGATTFAISLAWDLSATHSVLLVDFDMAGGTLADALELDTGGRSIAGLLTLSNVDGVALAAQAVAYPGRPRLSVIPGLRGFSGPAPGRVVTRVERAFRAADTDFVVVDFGAPLAHPDLESPRAAGESLAAAVQRTMVVLRDDPTLLPGSVQLLKQARVPQADFVVLRKRGSRVAGMTADVLAANVPGAPTWMFDWDERRGDAATYEGRILEQPGLARTLRVALPAGSGTR